MTIEKAAAEWRKRLSQAELARSRLVAEVQCDYAAGVPIATIARRADATRKTVYAWINEPTRETS